MAATATTQSTTITVIRQKAFIKKLATKENIFKTLLIH